MCVDGGVAFGPDVHVHAQVGCAEHPVPGLPHPQHVAVRFQGPEVGRLVLDVADDEQHVEDRLGQQAGDRGRPDVFDPSGVGAEGGYETLLLCLVTRWPAGVVRGEHDLTALRTTDQEGVVDGLLSVGHIDIVLDMRQRRP